MKKEQETKKFIVLTSEDHSDKRRCISIPFDKEVIMAKSLKDAAASVAKKERKDGRGHDAHCTTTSIMGGEGALVQVRWGDTPEWAIVITEA